MGYEFIDPPTSLKRMIRVAGKGGGVFNKLNRSYFYTFNCYLTNTHSSLCKINFWKPNLNGKFSITSKV